MMPKVTKIEFKLERPARKSGGDRYEANVPGEEKPMVLYIPQVISRPEGTPVLKLDVQITTG